MGLFSFTLFFLEFWLVCLESWVLETQLFWIWVIFGWTHLSHFLPSFVFWLIRGVLLETCNEFVNFVCLGCLMVRMNGKGILGKTQFFSLIGSSASFPKCVSFSVILGFFATQLAKYYSGFDWSGKLGGEDRFPWNWQFLPLTLVPLVMPLKGVGNFGKWVVNFS